MRRSVLLLCCLLLTSAVGLVVSLQLVENNQCFDCNFNNGPCCLSGQNCPGGSPCCGTCPTGNCGCQTNCTSNCQNKQCGSGGCSTNDCGVCGANSTCSMTQQCVCSAHCQCPCATGTSTSSCPTASQGCAAAGCACLGPQSPSVSVQPSGWYSVVEYVYQCCPTFDTGYKPCGGYAPVDLSVQPLQAVYDGEKGCATTTKLMMFVENIPSTVSDLFLYFGAGCSDTCGGLPFLIWVSNCSKTDYVSCMAQNNSCLEEETPTGCSTVTTIRSPGAGNGVWFKNPNVSPFTITLSVEDHYYQNPGCGNYAVGNFYTDQITVSYASP